MKNLGPRKFENLKIIPIHNHSSPYLIEAHKKLNDLPVQLVSLFKIWYGINLELYKNPINSNSNWEVKSQKISFNTNDKVFVTKIAKLINNDKISIRILSNKILLATEISISESKIKAVSTLIEFINKLIEQNPKRFEIFFNHLILVIQIVYILKDLISNSSGESELGTLEESTKNIYDHKYDLNNLKIDETIKLLNYFIANNTRKNYILVIVLKCCNYVNDTKTKIRILTFLFLKSLEAKTISNTKNLSFTLLDHILKQSIPTTRLESYTDDFILNFENIIRNLDLSNDLALITNFLHKSYLAFDKILKIQCLNKNNFVNNKLNKVGLFHIYTLLFSFNSTLYNDIDVAKNNSKTVISFLVNQFRYSKNDSEVHQFITFNSDLQLLFKQVITNKKQPAKLRENFINHLRLFCTNIAMFGGKYFDILFEIEKNKEKNFDMIQDLKTKSDYISELIFINNFNYCHPQSEIK